MIGNLSKLYQKHIGPGNGDYARDPGRLQTVAEDMPATAVGAGLGGAAGAAVGYGVGFHNLNQDTVSIVNQRTEYLRPELVGARYIPEDCTTQYTYDDKGQMTGSYQTCSSPYFSPIVQNHRTGLIEDRQKFQHSHSVGPLAGAAIGMGVGAISGALVGLLVQRLADPRADASAAQRSNRAPLIGVGVGALVGAGAGMASGLLAQSKAQTLTQVVHTPVTKDYGIGWVPYASDYTSLRGQMDPRGQLAYTDTEAFAGRSQVVRAYPTGEFRDHTEVTRSHSLSPLGGAALGLGIGAVAGGLMGVAVGVLDKVLSSQG